MSLRGDWLVRGYFDVADPEGGQSATQQVRNQLADRLNQPPSRVRIANYPVGPAWKHTFWWREGDVEYAEAQFFAQIADDYPVLSVGVSVEKGLEDETCAPAGQRDKYVMNRQSWDWKRLIRLASVVLDADVPACARALSRPLSFRLFLLQYQSGEVIRRERRTFVFAGERWFERHVGTATPAGITECLQELDQRRDWWVDAHFACDLPPAEADAMSAEAATEILWHFDGLRRRLRGIVS